MLNPTYAAAIDRDDDGDFSDPGEAITGIIEMEWRLGLAQPDDCTAAPGWARITVRNQSRAYSPETVTDLTPGKMLRITSDDGTLRSHFTGCIERIEPLAGNQGERLAVIHARTLDAQLAKHRVRLPAQVSIRADEGIAAVLDALPLRPWPLQGRWLVEVPGQSEIGVNTHLGGSAALAAEPGLSVFPYCGDTWDDGLPASSAIAELAASERGRFFSSRTGQMVFHNRHHLLLNTTPAAIFTDTAVALDYAYGADFANRVQVEITPRSIGVPGSTLWSLDTPQRIDPGEGAARRIIARYRDAADRPQGALDVLKPVPGLDYQANLLPDGSGADVTGGLLVTLVEASASAAVLDLRNLFGLPIYLLAGARLRGTPILLGDPLTVEAAGWTSLNRHGLRAYRIQTPALGTVGDADSLARYELARRQQPRGAVRSLTLSAAAHRPHILARTLFDRIRITESQTGHSGDYFIIAEEHRVELGGARHTARWLLEPAAASAFWVIETSRLDQTSVLAY
jgi:hypothetical protein